MELSVCLSVGPHPMCVCLCVSVFSCICMLRSESLTVGIAIVLGIVSSSSFSSFSFSSFFSREVKLNWFLRHIVDFSTQKIIWCFPSQLFLLIVFEVESLTESWTHWFRWTGWPVSFRVPHSFLTSPGPELQACMAMPALYLVGSNRAQVLRHAQQ